MYTPIFILLIIILSFISYRLFKNLSKTKKKVLNLENKFKPIIDIELKKKEIQNQIDSQNLLLTELSDKYKSSKKLYTELSEELRIYKEDIELIDFGVYEPIFDYDTSEKYKEELKKTVEEQKNYIRNGIAAVCNTNWTVSNSKQKGETMIKRGIQLTLRAFNGECNSLIAKVKWNNIEQYTLRIEKAFEKINKLNATNDIHITDDYKNLKIKELRLAYEYAHKKYEEKEEQKRIKEEIREEERAQRELEKARKEAEDQEKHFQRALEKAQKELNKAQGEKLNKLNKQIALLQNQLNEAKIASERAISRAQMTKSGHVYVISNLGSFGENIYKIGMTRRLEPLDRVKELGDASVPFQFDVHAMIYSDNAPELENTLHKEFNDKRVNLVNTRKEYFKVSLSEIENTVNKIHDAEIEFTKLAEAEEYRETLSMIKKQEKSLKIDIEKVDDKYPEELFN